MIRRAIVAIALVAVGFFISLGYSAVAQTNQTAPSTNSRQLSAIDRQYMLETSEAGIANIMLGQLALQKSTSPGVKQFAQAEIQEQTQVKKELTRIAPQLGVTLPTTPPPKYRAAMERLSQLSGERFNAAYMSEGGINAHLENAAIFQREAAFGRNPDLVAVATKGLPIIGQHFRTASTITNYKFAQVAQRFNDVPTSPGTSSSQSNNTPATNGTSTPQ